MKKLRLMVLPILAAMLMFGLSACGGDGYNPFAFVVPELITDDRVTIEPGWTGIDTNITATLEILKWTPGSGESLLDIGRTFHDPLTISTEHAAAATAVAQLFNQAFPNVQVNVHTRTGPHGVWQQARHNFYIENGFRPHIFPTESLHEELERGQISSLDFFANDPVWELFNPAIISTMTLFDTRWGLPWMVYPHGIFVNRSLAENQNLDPPPVDWNFRQFVDFVSHHRIDEFYGMQSPPVGNSQRGLFETLTPYINYNLINRADGEPFVMLNNEAHRYLNSYLPRIAINSFATNSSMGNVSAAFASNHGNSQWRMFSEGSLLAFWDNPWDISNANIPTHVSRIQVHDWDYFPRPSTDWMDNSIGVVLDPIVMHNFAMDDGDPTLSYAEYTMKRIAWEWMRFFLGDIRSFDARNNFFFSEIQRVSLDHSFPAVVGPMYWDIMDIWFEAPSREVFANANRFPGYHLIMQMWERNQLWGLWNNAFPLSHAGSGGYHMREWYNRHTSVGAPIHAPNWFDNLQAHLPNWDVLHNQRFQDHHELLFDAFVRFYWPPATRP